MRVKGKCAGVTTYYKYKGCISLREYTISKARKECKTKSQPFTFKASDPLYLRYGLRYDNWINCRVPKRQDNSE